MHNLKEHVDLFFPSICDDPMDNIKRLQLADYLSDRPETYNHLVAEWIHYSVQESIYMESPFDTPRPNHAGYSGYRQITSWINHEMDSDCQQIELSRGFPFLVITHLPAYLQNARVLHDKMLFLHEALVTNFGQCASKPDCLRDFLNLPQTEKLSTLFLDLPGDIWTDVSLNALSTSSHLAKLRALIFTDTSAETSTMDERLARAVINSPYLKNLKHLKIPTNDTGIEILCQKEKLPHLRSLALSGHIDGKSLNKLKDSGFASSLQILSLGGVHSIRNKAIKILSDIETLEELKILELENTGILPGGASCIASGHLKKLNDLSLENNEIDGNDLRNIAQSENFKKLRILNISGCLRRNTDNIGYLNEWNEFANSQKLPSLEKLHAARNNLDDSAIETLSEGILVKNLTLLNLEGNDIHHQGAKSLATSKILKKLNALILSNCEIGNSGAMELGRSSGLSGLTTIAMDRQYIEPFMRERAKSKTLKKLTTIYDGEYFLDVKNLENEMSTGYAVNI